MQLHERIVSGQVPARYLIFEPPLGQGIGNLLAGVESCLYLAMSSGRAILIHWEYPDIAGLFEPRSVDWRIQHAPPDGANSSDRATLKLVNLRGNRTSHHKARKILKSNVSVVHAEANTGMQGWESLSFGMLGHPNTTVKALVRPATRLKGCAFHSLFRVRNQSDLRTLWDEAGVSVPSGPRLGVQLRAGDISWGDPHDRRPVLSDRTIGLKDPRVGAQQAVECMQQVAAQVGLKPPCAILFESDSTEAKEAARLLGGGGPCRVWSSDIVPQHSATGGTNATLETWLALAMMSTVEALLVTSGTFGDAAGLLGPAFVEPQRMLKFEDFLIKRAKLKLPRNDTRDLCALSRQSTKTAKRLSAILA